MFNMSEKSNICLSGNNSTLQSTANPSEMGKLFSYNGNKVTMRMSNGVVYVNLTEVANAFPQKNLTQIVNSQEMKDYCEALSKLQNYSFTDLLIVSKGAPSTGGGTWAHQKVALRVAQKLSPEFAVWVDTKIEELLTTGVTTVKNDDEAIAYAMNVLNKRLEQAKKEKDILRQENELQKGTIEQQSEQLKEQAPKVEYADKVLSSAGTYCTNVIAKEMGMSARTLNAKLKAMGIQYKMGGTWLLTFKFQNKGYTKSKTVPFTRADGSPDSQMQTVWTERGRAFIHSMIEKANKKNANIEDGGAE